LTVIDAQNVFTSLYPVLQHVELISPRIFEDDFNGRKEKHECT
jgi:hypothetical protein